MAEEQRCYPESRRLCANNCGFFGSPATLHLCSKCYRDSAAKAPVDASALVAAAAAAAAGPAVAVASGTAPAAEERRGASRCAACRKRVGLTGFRCRCGGTYCGAHRYAERHDCGFDFKAAGREAISRANPVVKADKLDRI